MANQNVGTPRFYIDGLQWLHTNLGIQGYLPRDSININYTHPMEAIGLGVANQYIGSLLGDNFRENDRVWSWGGFQATDINPLKSIFDQQNDQNFVAILGHDFKSLNLKFYLKSWGWVLGYDNVNFINADIGTGIFEWTEYIEPERDGFSIIQIPSSSPLVGSDRRMIELVPEARDENGFQGDLILKIGALAVGRWYDMPSSPELSLTMSHEYDGVKNQKTAGGSTLSYIDYYKPPDWGALQDWQLEGWDRKYSGRRMWDLSWNHLSDSDTEPFHYHMDGSSTNAGFVNPNYKDNWFTNVLHYTNGGQLPFIFCPDPSISYNTSTWTIPEFAICRFDMKTFKRKQVANGVYNIKVKIEESW